MYGNKSCYVFYFREIFFLKKILFVFYLIPNPPGMEFWLKELEISFSILLTFYM